MDAQDKARLRELATERLDRQSSGADPECVRARALITLLDERDALEAERDGLKDQLQVQELLLEEAEFWIEGPTKAHRSRAQAAEAKAERAERELANTQARHAETERDACRQASIVNQERARADALDQLLRDRSIALASLKERGDRLAEAMNRVIEAAERALGDHYAPHDCFSTGPLTGNPIADLVACPGCAQQNEIAIARTALASYTAPDTEVKL